MYFETWYDLARFVLVSGMVVLALAVGGIGVRWLYRRVERPRGLGAGELDDLHAGLSRIDETDRRVAELEERLDFAERLLARQAEIDRLAGES
jgi:hypothetical protein